MNSKAVIAGVDVKHNQEDFLNSMRELGNLAAACNIDVVAEITQKLHRINNSYYFGEGKITELRALVKETAADLVIFEDEVSPSQIRNLEKELDCEVMDRTMLILAIFSNRAKTRESQLQVEVARLKYMLPRLIGMRDDLGRQGGGAGLKNRGAGETKLELDRRKIEERITKLSKELEQLATQRKTQRKQRGANDIPVVSLVGYTNAGKSTIMNAMLEKYSNDTNKQVFEKNMLFATLGTSVRKIKLANNRTFLLTDTVGFIHKLPHHLIKAFRSTLEEVAEADLLVHVIDASNPLHEEQKNLTNKVLEEIGVHDIPIVYAYNKADLIKGDKPLINEPSVLLSAKKRSGIDDLTEQISKYIFTDYIQCDLLIPFTDGVVVSYFNEHSQVLHTEFEAAGTRLKVNCKKADAEKYTKYCL
ncbi:GTPase HflX [Bacillaceae bacterium Marseille-Q3522]|nr:GTPase HflX [Bacillaceae bacterium Marseille-Q3522]